MGPGNLCVWANNNPNLPFHLTSVPGGFDAHLRVTNEDANRRCGLILMEGNNTAPAHINNCHGDADLAMLIGNAFLAAGDN